MTIVSRRNYHNSAEIQTARVSVPSADFEHYALSEMHRCSGRRAFAQIASKAALDLG
jgi:hypothetical protein